MTCPECGSEWLRFWPAIPGNREEPPEPENWECLDCGHMFAPDDDNDE